jgi:type III secretion system FlhB-like substrate exporter
MVSATLQVSLSLREVNLLEEEAKGQMAIAIRGRLDALARGEKASTLKAIGPATIAAQIIRRALPELEVKIEKDKKEKLEK